MTGKTKTIDKITAKLNDKMFPTTKGDPNYKPPFIILNMSRLTRQW